MVAYASSAEGAALARLGSYPGVAVTCKRRAALIQLRKARTSGTCLGRYEIVAPIGAGGMARSTARGTASSVARWR